MKKYAFQSRMSNIGIIRLSERGNKEREIKNLLKKHRLEGVHFHFGMLHEFACDPCAGAMLIFSVSF